MDAATLGNINREKLQALGLALANEQLQVEDHLVESNRMVHQQATASERRGRQETVLARLRDDWDGLSFDERQDLLRGVVARVVVKDDGIENRFEGLKGRVVEGRWIVYADGASRGNPGPSSIGAVVFEPGGREAHVVSRRIGRATNNEAEYQAAIAGVEAALGLGATRIELAWIPNSSFVSWSFDTR